MSNIIPILSSSPPPIDDTPSFEDDWENEDFGGFQGAGPSGGTPGFANNIPGPNTTPVPGGQQQQPQQHIKSIEKTGIIKASNDKDPEDDWADFSGPASAPPPHPLPPSVVDGEFVAFPSNDIQTGPSSSVNNSCPDGDDNIVDDLTSDQQGRSASMGLHLQNTTDRTVAHGDGRKSPRSSSSSSGSHEDRRNSSGEDFTNTKPHDATSKVCKPDSQDNTSQDSVTDSGLCSDISPVPKFEEYPDFGDNKSSEVEFSDEGNNSTCTTNANRVSLEQDEGFANFAAVDSCGTGSDKSPDSSSQQADSFSNFNSDPDPLDLRPPEVTEEGMENFAQFSCSGCEGSQEWDGDALTPTQSQYDVDNVYPNSPSPNPQSSPDLEKSDEPVDLTISLNTLNQSELTPAESKSNSNKTILDNAPEHSKQSHNQHSSYEDNFTTPSQDDDNEEGVCQRPSSACDSSGTETNTPAYSAPVTEPSLTDASTSQSAQAAMVSTHARSSADTKACQEEGQARWSGPEEEEENDADKEDDWEFQDAVTTQDHAEVNTAVLMESVEHTESGDEFGDFAHLSNAADKSKGADDSDEYNGEDEDDDWAFQAGVAASEEDFGNFASTAPGEGFAAFADSTETSEGSDNWASFSEPAAVPPADDEDDQFGNFDDATVVSSETRHSFSAGQTLRQISKEPVEVVVDKMFSLPEQLETLPPVDLLFAHMTKQNLREEHQVLSKQPGRHPTVRSVSVDMNVWNNLRDLEKTAALRYTWDKSMNNNCLLHALSIDTRNILIGHKKSSVPIFASNLGVGVLEPCRGPPEVGREGRVSEGGTNTLATTAKLTAGTPQDIPPAEFDWSSAGLTNPLDSSNVQLDLDFFVKKTAWSGPSAYTATSPTAALENELLKAIEPEQSKQPKTLEPLENYLANLKVTSTAPPTLGKESDADQLTEPAFDMVSKLPDLSFMRAKMLMFPVKGTSD